MQNISLISDLHPALLLSVRRTLGGLPGPLVLCLVKKLFLSLAVKFLSQWEFGGPSPFAISGYMAEIYPRFSFWGGECWGEPASLRVCRELWSMNCPSEEALTVTAVRSQRWMQLGELESVSIVCTMCGAQSLLCKSAKSHAFHCFPWVAIKRRGRALFLSKSKVSRQKGQNIQSHKNINTLDRKIPQETNARSPFGDHRRLIFVSLQNGAKLYPWPL